MTSEPASNDATMPEADAGLLLLVRTMQDVSTAESFDEALKLTVDHICQTTGWPYGEAWVGETSSDRIVLSGAWSGHPDDSETLRHASEGRSYGRGEGLVGRVWQSQTPSREADGSSGGGSEPTAPLQERLAIPIAGRDATLAVLVFTLAEDRDVDDRMVEIVAGVAAQTGVLFQLRRSEEMLRLANAELESFTYSVSHDLRAPLRAMDGFSEALIEDYGGALDDTAADYLRRIRNASRQMAALIDALLGFSRLSRSSFRREPVDLSGMAAEIVDDLRRTEPGRNVDVRIAPGLTAYCDRNLMRVVLQNLLGNAWKFTGQTDSPQITFGSEARSDGKVFFVSDNGAGFDMAYADKLFRPFQRLHGMQEFSGTGIGLATVARIIHRHGGRVRAEGAVDSGATVYFTL